MNLIDLTPESPTLFYRLPYLLTPQRDSPSPSVTLLEQCKPEPSWGQSTFPLKSLDSGRVSLRKSRILE